LRRLELVSIGAAGTFVAHRARSVAAFERALAKALPFEADIAICGGGDLREVERRYTALGLRPSPGLVHFVSILASPPALGPAIPFDLPSKRNWYVRVLAAHGPFVLGVYRRQMRTIGYLNQLPEVFGASVTTRSWTTIASVLRALEARGTSKE
jgi:hypothetical protein